MRKLRFALVLLGLAGLAFVSWIFGIMMAVAQDLPSLESREQYKRAENSIVYDVRGQRLATLTNNQGRILLTSEEISPAIKEAVVAIEDQRFYEHRGVDFQGIGRALYQDILSRSTEQGASTITQQFVKNALATQDSRTILQKFREAAIAYHLERQWSKDKILTEYLNEIYFGEGATGIEAAARTYFGSAHPGCGQGDDAEPCASQLLPWEAALLAGMISSPSAYSPRANPGAALERRNLVLQRMTEEGYLTEEEYAKYAALELPGEDDIAPPQENSLAPYFTSWLRQQLVDRYGAGEAFGGGLEITSTLDLDLQREVESIVAGRLAGIEPTASVVVLDNDTAAVRAMVAGPELPGGALQPRHQRPPPARLGVQAVHADHRPRTGPLDRGGLRLGAPGDPVPGAVREQEGQDGDGQRAVRGEQLRGLLPRLGRRSRPRRPTPTTPSTRSWAPPSGPTTSPRPPRRWASRPTSRPTPSTRSPNATSSPTTPH